MRTELGPFSGIHTCAGRDPLGSTFVAERLGARR